MEFIVELSKYRAVGVYLNNPTSMSFFFRVSTDRFLKLFFFSSYINLRLLLTGIIGSWGADHFLNHRPFPTYSLENMPSTGFTCRDKILGGYYADPDTQCQMFHICVKVAGVGVSNDCFVPLYSLFEYSTL